MRRAEGNNVYLLILLLRLKAGAVPGTGCCDGSDRDGPYDAPDLLLL